MILDDNDRFRQFLIAILEERMGEIDIIEVTSARVAIMLFESDPYFEGFLASLDVKNGTFMEVFQHFREKGYTVPFITYSGEKQDTLHESLPFIHQDEENNFKQFSHQLFKTPPFAKAPLTDKDFSRIRMFFFWRFHKVDFSLYLKLGDGKFVKVLHPDEEYGPDFLEKYQDKGQDYLYIESKDFDKFALSLYKKPLHDIDENLAPEEKSRRKTQFIQQMAASVGITPDIVKTADESVKEVIQEAKDKKTLSKLLELLEKSSSYNSDHSTLLCYLTSAMCDELGWTTRRSKEKLGFASLFHDVSLTDPRLAVLNYRSLKALDKFPHDVKKKYKNHPLKGSELVGEITNEYPQVDTIIAQHHERPDGSGFPYGRDFNQIIPLSCLFIVAHDFVSRAYEKNFDLKSPQEILDDMLSEYTQGNFMKCMIALQTVVTKYQLQKES